MVNSWMTYKSKFGVNVTRVPLNIFLPGPFCDMEDLEDTQAFYEYSLPDVFTPDSINVSMVMEAMNLLREEGTGQILNLVT